MVAQNTILLMPRKGPAKRFARLRPRSVTSKAGLRASLPKAGKDTLWISDDPGQIAELLKSVKWPTRRLGDAILLFNPALEALTALRKCFDRIAFGAPGGFLPGEELAEALTAENRSELFIGGAVDHQCNMMTLWRGNLDSLVVPFTAFPPSGDGTAPNFDDFAVADYGQTVQLGKYEAATDAILYEFDPEYRRRKAKQRRASEQSLGASIRRLRKQRGLRREDFAPLAPKTIARIEQGKVAAIHDSTKAAIAKRLKVSPDELASY
ncbi:MAG: helix-turn-helix transcriptional regulator [Pirellulales bacterium]